MIKFKFDIEKERFDRRVLTEIQHKLRVALKCYTVKEFKMFQEGIYSFFSTRRMTPSKKIMVNNHVQYAKYDKIDSPTDQKKYEVCLSISTKLEELQNELKKD